MHELEGQTRERSTVDDVVIVDHVRKSFSYTNPDPNANQRDMWVAYLLGMIGKARGQFAAQRADTVALAGVSLTIKRGEFFGLLGPNGAGKTTLIKVLSTILRQNGGQIRVNGHDTVRDAARARASLSVVPSAGWLSFDHQLTLTQGLVFWGRLAGLSVRESTQRARAALDVVDLGEWRDETPNHLSSGMRQRLAIAKGLLVRAPVFVLDEPTANVDPIIAWQIRDFLRNELNRQLGQTILLATHNMAEAEQLCDRVAIIDQGRLLVCDRPATLTASLADRVVEIGGSHDVTSATHVLRHAQIARHITDSPGGDDNAGTLRLLLNPDATHSDLRSVLDHHGLDAATIASVKPTLEDVFLHYAGRSRAVVQQPTSTDGL